MTALTGTCPHCDGRGWDSIAVHASTCDGNCRQCPVEEQEQCATCGGSGQIDLLPVAVPSSVQELGETLRVYLEWAASVESSMDHWWFEDPADALVSLDRLVEIAGERDEWKYQVQQGVAEIVARAEAAEARVAELTTQLQRVVQADRDDTKMGYPIPGDSCLAACIGLEVMPLLEALAGKDGTA